MSRLHEGGLGPGGGGIRPILEQRVPGSLPPGLVWLDCVTSWMVEVVMLLTHPGPVTSSDVNPSEHLWDRMHRLVQHCPNYNTHRLSNTHTHD